MDTAWVFSLPPRKLEPPCRDVESRCGVPTLGNVWYIWIRCSLGKVCRWVLYSGFTTNAFQTYRNLLYSFSSTKLRDLKTACDVWECHLCRGLSTNLTDLKPKNGVTNLYHVPGVPDVWCRKMGESTLGQVGVTPAPPHRATVRCNGLVGTGGPEACHWMLLHLCCLLAL